MVRMGYVVRGAYCVINGTRTTREYKLDKRSYFCQWFLLQRVCRNLHTFRRVADDEEQEGALVAGALQDLVEETHRAGGMGEADQPGMV